jgi:glucuronoarabinoxylan endo-1,4-beta-xylanase
MKRFLKIFFILIFLVTTELLITKISASEGVININQKHQKIIGFGASIAWYGFDLTRHRKKAEIYNHIFEGLGLDILRIRNQYGKDSFDYMPEIINRMREYSDSCKILISSWSPQSELKSNSSLNGGDNATLKKENGEYVYGAFAQYWIDALNAYKEMGIEPDYISIQNEPSYDAAWQSCRFEPTETSTIAGFDFALDSVCAALEFAGLSPKITAPEVHGIGYNTFQNYAQYYNHDLVDGYAFHLYHGESDNVNDNHNPDLFNLNFSRIAQNYSAKPIWQTEYDRGDWFNTVWLIYNGLVNGNLAAYLYWELVWIGGKPLVQMNGDNYILTDEYWAFRQYSKYIYNGWQRISAASDDQDLLISAFTNPAEDKLTVVIINRSDSTDKQMNLTFNDFNVSSAELIRTSETDHGIVLGIDQNDFSALEFPARSITTLDITGEKVTSLERNKSLSEKFTLHQNYPNPFNPSTVISYQLPVAGNVKISIYNLLGKKVATLVSEKLPAGIHEVEWDAKGFSSGVYFYRMQAGNFVSTKKILLIR